MKITRSPDLARELHLVRDDEHRHAFAGEIAHDDEHLADELRVECRRDLVEEHHVRLHHQRPGDRDPLLLAARELVRVLIRLLREADAREELPAAPLRLATRHLADPPGGERKVVDRRQVWEEVELLEDDPDPLADRRHVGALAGDLLALEEDAARLDRLEQVDAAKERALPAAARADDDEDLAQVDAEVDAVQHEVVAEALANALEPDRGDAVRLLLDGRLRSRCSLPELNSTGSGVHLVKRLT